MKHALFLLLLGALTLFTVVGCDTTPAPSAAAPAAAAPTGWLGTASAVHQVTVWLHEGTGWLLNKGQVSVTKVGDVRRASGSGDGHVADFQIAVTKGGNRFETTARDVPCDGDGIPTEQAVTRLREAVEDIKAKIKRLQK
jgi:hypothetical protein